MMTNLSEIPSVANQYLAEMRDSKIQQDSMRFRRNLERLGEVFAYEISKTFDYGTKQVDTPLGSAQIALTEERVVLATILRAGLPLHQGLLNVFDKAENAFVSAYRKNHKDGTFEIEVEYISCPPLEGCTLILCDSMLATGASMVLAAESLLQFGQPKTIHFVSAIAAQQGLDYVRRKFNQSLIWLGALDEELTAKSYIVPGLGDAGDLSYGEKIQE
ncbi:MAG: uracil phosphoribosyltransferase [Lewinella sp.]|nr:uracil phosphoribosyltransferase [Lewinella sp.]